jgi:outer membrane protein assembly factor BamB
MAGESGRQIVSALVGASVVAAMSATPAAAVEIAWGRQFGTHRFDVALDVDAGRASSPFLVVVGGSTAGVMEGRRMHGIADAFVAAFWPSGATRWVRQFGGRGEDMANDVAVTDDAVYATGAYHREVGVVARPRRGGGDDVQPNAWIRRFAPNGHLVWEDRFGGPGWDEARSIAVDATGAYVVGTGRIDGTGHVFGFLRKYSHDGKVVWTIGLRDARDVATEASGAYACGIERLPPDGLARVVVGFDVDGAVRWRHVVEEPFGGCDQLAASDGMVYLGGDRERGTAPSEAPELDAWVQGLTSDGSPVFRRVWDVGVEDWVAGLAASAHGVTVATGIDLERVEVRRYSPTGTRRWASLLPTRATFAVGNGVAVVDRAVFAAGWVEDGHLPGERELGAADAFLVRLDT